MKNTYHKLKNTRFERGGENLINLISNTRVYRDLSLGSLKLSNKVKSLFQAHFLKPTTLRVLKVSRINVDLPNLQPTILAIQSTTLTKKNSETFSKSEYENSSNSENTCSCRQHSYRQTETRSVSIWSSDRSPIIKSSTCIATCRQLRVSCRQIEMSQVTVGSRSIACWPPWLSCR